MCDVVYIEIDLAFRRKFDICLFWMFTFSQKREKESKQTATMNSRLDSRSDYLYAGQFDCDLTGLNGFISVFSLF